MADFVWNQKIPIFLCYKNLLYKLFMPNIKVGIDIGHAGTFLDIGHTPIPISTNINANKKFDYVIIYCRFSD